MQYISTSVKMAFREACVVHLVLAQIESIFEAAGIGHAELPPGFPVGGARRTLVEEYYASVNWARVGDCRRVLEAFSTILSQSYVPDEAKEELRQLCRDEGLIVEGNRVYLDQLWGIDGLLDSTHEVDSHHFRRFCDRMRDSVADDPEAAIGSAKELVEGASRYVLERRGQQLPASTEFTKLVKSALAALDLRHEDIPDAAKGREAIVRVLSALGQTVDGLSRLRNLYGTGHGRAPRSGAIKARHAKLAVGAATTLSTFMLETMSEREK